MLRQNHETADFIKIDKIIVDFMREAYIKIDILNDLNLQLA